MSFERARAIADAVLLEGYVLYPYRALSTKNRYRWNFGVVAPELPGTSEPSWLASECWLEAGAELELSGRLRFLHVEERAVQVADGEGFFDTECLEIDGKPYLSWQEGALEEVDFELSGGGQQAEEFRFSVPASANEERLFDSRGRLLGRVLRTRAALEGVVQVALEPVEVLGRLLTRLSLVVRNATSLERVEERAETLPRSMISTHILLWLRRRTFLSPLETAAFPAVREPTAPNQTLYPVLVGSPGSRDLLLCSPIILEEYPAIAPESPGHFFDSGEIDELLTLRTLTLTEREKLLARATDARAAEVLDRVESLSEAGFSALHGKVREYSGRGRFAAGDRVRLRPGKRRTDAQDLLFAGCAATIQAVRCDAEGRDVLALTIDADPAAELHRWYGRFHYYYADEVEPLEEASSP